MNLVTTILDITIDIVLFGITEYYDLLITMLEIAVTLITHTLSCLAVIIVEDECRLL